jgi:hypothetical protein
MLSRMLLAALHVRFNSAAVLCVLLAYVQASSGEMRQ